MWIIPENLHTLASVQDTAAWISDLDELSALCEQSLLARSSTTPARTWSRRLRLDCLTARLSGRTLKPSRGARFVDEWTSSLGASLASHLAPPDNAQETATPGTYGPTSPAASESWDDLPLFSLKMWTESSAPSSQAPSGQTPQGHLSCSMSSASWNAWVTEQRQEYSARAKSAPRTNEGACSYLAYEMTSTSPRAVLFQSCWSAQGVIWATSQRGPLDEEPRNTPGSPHESQGAARWATPSQRDGLRIGETTGAWRARAERKKTEGVNLHRPLSMEVILDAETQTPPPTGQLNPRWVETLMGLPVGWTMATCAAPWTVVRMSCAYLETESSQPQQSEPSASSGGAWPTPQARDHKGSSGRSNAGEELDLPAAVQRATHPRVPPSDPAD